MLPGATDKARSTKGKECLPNKRALLEDKQKRIVDYFFCNRTHQEGSKVERVNPLTLPLKALEYLMVSLRGPPNKNFVESLQHGYFLRKIFAEVFQRCVKTKENANQRHSRRDIKGLSVQASRSALSGY